MYYNTPNVTSYIYKIRKHRLKIIFGYLFITVLSLLLYRPEFIASDTFFWLSESKEAARTKTQSYETDYIGRLEISTDAFNEAAKERLDRLQGQLEGMTGVRHVDSLFTSYHIYNDSDGNDSSLVSATPLEKMDAESLEAFVKRYHAPYANFVNEDFSKISYFIYSSEPLKIEGLDIPFSHTFSAPNVEAGPGDYLFYALAVIFSIVLFFRLLFHNYISAFAGILVISLTLIATFTFSCLITGIRQVHIAMSLIVVSIALLDYLYFYYRWHVSQYKADMSRAMLKAINRNLSPAFWTSLITVIGLGPLLLVDSVIVQQLSLSVILASVFAYILNLTLLPALLSFFSVRHPRVAFARYCYLFANGEIHYNKNFLKFFLGASTIIMFVGTYQLFFGQERLFADNVDKDVISIMVPYDEIDVELMKKIDSFEQQLQKENQGVKEVYSVLTVMKLLNDANSNQKIFSEQNLLQSRFFLELYDLEDNLFSVDALNIRITLEDVDKNKIVRWLQNYQELPIYFTDMDTLQSSAKIGKMSILGFSLGSALLIIGLIMGWIFRNKEMVFVGFITNAIPIMWFGLILNLSNIPLSLEVLIAMTITVGLASDATVHFAYKYYRSRFFGRTQKHALEVMFFYAGVPVIIGGLSLVTVFALLTLTDLHSLQLIGGYGALLMILSLATDLLILPVLLLAIDRFHKADN